MVQDGQIILHISTDNYSLAIKQAARNSQAYPCNTGYRFRSFSNPSAKSRSHSDQI